MAITQIIFCGFAMLLGMVLVYVNGVIMMYGNNTARAQYAAKVSHVVTVAVPKAPPRTSHMGEWRIEPWSHSRCACGQMLS